MSTLTDETGRAFARELCEQAQRLQGGLVEYRWPRPDKQQ
jgi:signal transduction histidine kinase